MTHSMKFTKNELIAPTAYIKNHILLSIENIDNVNDMALKFEDLSNPNHTHAFLDWLI
jgi:hypothetical protein